MSLSAALSASFGLLFFLLLIGVTSAEGSTVRRTVGRVLGFLMRRNWMLRVLHRLLTRRGAGTKVAYVLVSLAWVWFVTVVQIAVRSIASLPGGPPGPGFGDMPLTGQLFASFVLLFIGTIWVLLAAAFITAIVSYPLALAIGLAKRGGADRAFAVRLLLASGVASTALAVLAWSGEA